MKVFVHIERLRLSGIAPEAVETAVAALRKQLSLDYASPALATKWGAAGHRDRMRARFAFSEDPERLGREAAHAISRAGAE